MNIFIILTAIVGVVLAQQGDIKDCEPRQSSLSARDVQDIYQRPVGYEALEYNPQTTYGPPDPVRPSLRRPYPQDLTDGANGPRPTFVQPPVYTDIRQTFPYAPVYGPAPPRARVAAAAGIYDDYEDIQYAQPAPPPLITAVRRYNINYAHREPYQANLGYDVLPGRNVAYRVPVYYAPIPEAYYPVRVPALAQLVTTTPTTTTTTEETRTQPPVITIPHRIHGERYDSSSVEDDSVLRRGLKRPLSGLARLFRGSVIAARNKVGLIPSIVQASVNRLA